MLEIIIVLLFCWLFFKALGLAFRLAWGTVKIVVSILFAIAVPLLIGMLMFVGGLMLLIPLAIMGLAWGLLKSCV